MTASRSTPSTAPRFALALGLAAVIALTACSGGSGGDGDASADDEAETSAKAGEDGKLGEEKRNEAVPVEVAAVAERRISASYSGTANLEVPADAMVVAKTSGVLLRVLVEEGETQYVECRIKMGFMVGRPDLSPSSAEEFVQKGEKLKMVDDDDMGEGALRSTDIEALK